ncbi:hypothetical protein MTP04_02100 [Lysinibacillus sp. PLM2]|nr:hypothetical protein MTP04_02100 [Lysinibacillus sp. PLM2]
MGNGKALICEGKEQCLTAAATKINRKAKVFEWNDLLKKTIVHLGEIFLEFLINIG